MLRSPRRRLADVAVVVAAGCPVVMKTQPHQSSGHNNLGPNAIATI